MDKLRYLLSTLYGEAREAVGNLSLQADDYQVAFDRLYAIYDHSIVQTLMGQMFSLQRIQEASYADLRAIIDTVNDTLNDLSHFVSIDIRDPIIESLVTERLDKQTCNGWHMHLREKIQGEDSYDSDSKIYPLPPPKWTEFEKFLELRAQDLFRKQMKRKNSQCL